MSDLEKEEQEEQHQEDLSPEVSAELSPEPASELSPEPAPNKRLSDAEPEELVHALRQVFNGNDDKSTIVTSNANTASAYRGAELAKEKAQLQAAEQEAPVEAKSGYTNPFSLFADVFYGVLIAPRQTLLILSDSSKFPPTLANLFLTFVLVLSALSLPAAIKVGAAGGSAEGVLKGLAFVLANLADWAVLAFILYYLSIWLRGNKLTLGNAFIATGWAYLPFAFFAPVACFKGALGNGFTLFACGPALWFIALQWLAFQTSLRTTTIKLALIALVVPPVFCLVYLFWIGLAVFSLLAQLLSHLT